MRTIPNPHSWGEATPQQYSLYRLLAGLLLLAIWVAIPLLNPPEIRDVVLQSPSESRGAVAVYIDSNIDGGSLMLLERGVSTAAESGLALVLVINSYGGYVSAADKMVETLIGSGVECYSFIPPGGKAASAAAMIAIACGEIYMGEGSSIGAAIPIPTDNKTVNYVASRFRALASRAFEGNETLVSIAVRFVTESLTLSDREAISIGFASRASSLDDVLSRNNLSLVDSLSQNIVERLVSVISDPFVASIALTIGFYIILAEIFTSGFQGYAVAGVLLIAMALYGMTIIAPDILILAILLSGIVLIIAEMLSPGFGVFGVAGVVLLGAGVYMLLGSRPPGTLRFEIWSVVIALIGFGGVLGVIMYKAGQAMRLKRRSLEEKIVGSVGIAKTDFDESSAGIVYVAGEDWTAYSVRGRIKAGSRVRVVSMEGLKLYVEPYSGEGDTGSDAGDGGG